MKCSKNALVRKSIVFLCFNLKCKSCVIKSLKIASLSNGTKMYLKVISMNV